MNVPYPLTSLNNLQRKEDEFLNMLATAMELPFERLKEIEIESTLLDSVPQKQFSNTTHSVREENQSLLFATADPVVRPRTYRCTSASYCPPRSASLSPLDITEAARKFYGVGAETLDQMISNNPLDFDDEGDLLKQDLSDLDQEASVVKFVNQIIWEAYKDRATDIHIEPMETDLRIRYRIDGVLRETPMPPQLKRFQSSVISRIKVMANMDIAENDFRKTAESAFAYAEKRSMFVFPPCLPSTVKASACATDARRGVS